MKKLIFTKPLTQWNSIKKLDKSNSYNLTKDFNENTPTLEIKTDL